MEQSRRKVQTPSINKQKQHLFLGQKPSKQTLLKRLPDYYNAITIRNKNTSNPYRTSKARNKMDQANNTQSTQGAIKHKSTYSGKAQKNCSPSIKV